MAPVSRSLPRTSVQFSKGRFVVTMTLWRSYAVLITSNRSSEPTLLAGTYPSSSRMSRSSFSKLSFQPQEYSFFAGFQQLRDQFCDPVEPNSPAPTTGCNRQCDCHVRFPRSGIADQQDVLSLVDVLTEHQFVDQDFVERWLCLKVEGVQCFVCRELRGLEASF